MRRLLLSAGTVTAAFVGWILLINPELLNQRMKQKGISTFQESGVQIGVRRTYPVSLQETWSYLLSPSGVRTWLGVEDFQPSPGKSFTNDLGQGEIKIIKELSHIRMVWKRHDWNEFSSLQIRVFRADHGTTVSFHQEKIANEAARAEMVRHWEQVLDEIAQIFQVSRN